jgi:fructokinase
MTFVVAGEALVDVVVPPAGEPEHIPGGSPLNVAVGLARLGVTVELVTEVGDDDLGRLVLGHLRDSDVPLADGCLVPGLRTSTATAHLDRTGAATYDFDLRWDLTSRPLAEDATGLHVGSIGAALRPGRGAVVDLVREAVARDLLVTFDPNSRPAFTPDAARAWSDAREVAADCDVVKMSDEDLRFLRPGSSAEEIARELLDAGTRLVVVTFGGGGATAFSQDAAVEVRSEGASVVDTVGAGDSFMAALVGVVIEHGLQDLGEVRLRAYLTAAHQAAAVTVSRRGADPPRRDELPVGWPNVP